MIRVININKSIIIIALFILFFTMDMYASNIIKVKAIKFRGLNYVSKYEIVNKAGIRTTDGGFIVDLDYLHKALSQLLIVDTYKILKEDNDLVIAINEKKPVMVLFLIKEDQHLVPFELDKNFNIISRDVVHNDTLPLVYIAEKGIKKREVIEKIKNLYYILQSIAKNEHSIYREISEIYLNHNIINIILNGRKTVFMLKADKDHFKKLKYIVGYLDRIGYYPDTLSVSDKVVIR